MSPQNELQDLLTAGNDVAGRFLSEQEIAQLLRYYELVCKWNRALPLTTDIAPQDFYQRHLSEACFLVRHICADVTSIWDLGTGVGIPGIPSAILRPDLPVTLVEANRRKAIFLEEVVDRLALNNVKVQVTRLETLDLLPFGSLVTARAVEKMAQLLPTFLKLGENSAQLLLLGGADLQKELTKLLSPQDFIEALPLRASEASFLFNVQRFT